VKPEDVLSKYSLSEETAAGYIDAITRSNQTQTAEELGVSRDTINRYKNAFNEMKPEERLLLISALAQDQLLDQTTQQP
jgi:DNA-binding XRE family transcriptional regulator